MAGITPISVALSDLSSLSAGDLLPSLARINILLDRHLTAIDNNLQQFTGFFASILTNLYTLQNGELKMLGTSLQVYETNPDLLDLLKIAKEAVAYFSYVQMNEVFDDLNALRARAGQISSKLDLVNLDLIGIYAEIIAIGDCLCTTLQEILDLLKSGLKLNAILTIKIDAGSLGDIFKGLDLGKLWQLLGIAALGVLLLVGALAALVAFVYALGAALSGFTMTSVLAIFAISGLIAKLTELAVALSKMSVGDIAGVIAGLAALGGFVYALGKAVQAMDAETLKALPKLGEFIDKLKDLAVALAAMSFGDIATMTAGLAALSGFVYALGVALNKMSADVLNALPKINGFITTLKDLATTLAAMPAKDIAGMAAGLAALAGFVYTLGLALAQMNAQVLEALPNLSSFITTLQSLATTLAALPARDVAGMVVGLAALAGFVYVLVESLNQLTGPAVAAIPLLSGFIATLMDMARTLAGMSALDLLGMGIGLALLAGFIYFLGVALNNFSQNVLDALPAINQLILALTAMAVTLGGMSAGDLISMGIAFALIAGFVYLLAGALDIATPGLLALASVLENLDGLIDKVTSGIGGLAAALLSLPSLGELGGLLGGLEGGGILEGIGGLLPELLPILLDEGGLVTRTGLAVVHAGERVLNPEETQSLTNASNTAASAIPGGPLGGGGGMDNSVHLEGVTIHIQAASVDANSAAQLSDEIIRHLQERLGALRAEQEFRTGTRVQAPI
jgi:hypothetical protein